MKILWQPDPADIRAVQSIVTEYRDNPLVVDRKRRNLAKSKPPVSDEQFWKCLVGALLTTQQRSGPESAVGRFMSANPFPLDLGAVRQSCSPGQLFEGVLGRYKGLRMRPKIAKQLETNLQFLNADGWSRRDEGVRLLN